MSLAKKRGRGVIQTKRTGIEREIIFPPRLKRSKKKENRLKTPLFSLSSSQPKQRQCHSRYLPSFPPFFRRKSRENCFNTQFSEPDPAFSGRKRNRHRSEICNPRRKKKSGGGGILFFFFCPGGRERRRRISLVPLSSSSSFWMSPGSSTIHQVGGRGGGKRDRVAADAVR